MQLARTLNGIFLLIALAAAGMLMVWVPTQVVEQYQAVKDLGEFWVYLYFSVVGTGAAILLGVTGYTLYTLWSRRSPQTTTPSGA